jgi:hypothetical protein
MKLLESHGPEIYISRQRECWARRLFYTYFVRTKYTPYVDEEDSGSVRHHARVRVDQRVLVVAFLLFSLNHLVFHGTVVLLYVYCYCWHRSGLRSEPHLE